MNHRQQYELLNALLIGLGRSLLQYAVEAWPWTHDSEQELRDEVFVLAERQAQAATAIADYLGKSNRPVDFGNYPVDYTDLNYISLDYLLGELARNADEVLARIHETRRQVDDAEASVLLGRVEDEQRSIAARLRALADDTKPAVV